MISAKEAGEVADKAREDMYNRDYESLFSKINDEILDAAKVGMKETVIHLTSYQWGIFSESITEKLLALDFVVYVDESCGNLDISWY